MEYQCIASSVEGFVQQLAVAYLPHGFWFYVTGHIPEHKDQRSVDQKLLSKYGIAVSRNTRARRKRAGLANLHYLRHDRFFVLLATHGQHIFFDEERNSIRDVRRAPISFAGYSISFKRGNRKRKSPAGVAAPDDKWHARVQIARDRYRELKAFFGEIATHRSAGKLASEFARVPFEPYAPVRQQLLNLLRLVNKARKMAGYESVPPTVLRLRRRIVRPFEPRQ